MKALQIIKYGDLKDSLAIREIEDGISAYEYLATGKAKGKVIISFYRHMNLLNRNLNLQL